jgi:hypothetical protein
MDGARRARATRFPPRPLGLKGRSLELAALERIVLATRPARVALVGSGGSGKSVLAAALGHRLAPRFGGRVHWFRIGAWDFHTLTEMLALHFGTPRDDERRVPALQALLGAAERLIVLDNHEDDSATARLLQAFSDARASFVITARRCLLSAVSIYPVTAPLATAGRGAFPRVASLTRVLRHNPLALDIADSLVVSHAATARQLLAWLEGQGIGDISVIEHEDDLPEVKLLVEWAWEHLGDPSRRLLGVLAHAEGDHMDVESLAALARLRSRPREALAPLVRWHLVQEPKADRYTVHAVVRHAVRRWTRPDPDRLFRHFVTLLEREPQRFELEQTHLFAAMDHAHRRGDLRGMLRIERLLHRQGGLG